MARQFLIENVTAYVGTRPHGGKNLGLKFSYEDTDPYPRKGELFGGFPTPPGARNQRSRGPHDAGDGDYENRWVFPNGAHLVDTSGRSFDWFVDQEWVISDSSTYYFDAMHWERWDGLRYTFLIVECRRRGNPGIAGNWVANIVDLQITDIVRARSSAQWTLNMRGSRNSHTVVLGSKDDFGPGTAYTLGKELYASGEFIPFEPISTASPYRAWSMFYREDIAQPQFSAEMSLFRDKVSLLPQFGVDSLIAAAFVQAVDDLPTLGDMNNIANIFEWLSLLWKSLSFLVNPKITNIGDVRDLWLGYRYAYCTTKADLQEAVSYADRIIDACRVKRFRARGSASRGEWTVRSSISLETSSLSHLKTTLEKYNLQLDGYNMWDLVPYSFVVDWFLDVGSLLSLYRDRNIAMRLRKKGSWFSIERRWKNEYGFEELYYWRFFKVPNLAWVGRTSKGARAVTWLKRSLDAIALFS